MMIMVMMDAAVGERRKTADDDENCGAAGVETEPNELEGSLVVDSIDSFETLNIRYNITLRY
jgi:hypothetical protein